MTKKMMMFAAACLLVVFAAIPCFAQSEELVTAMLKDGVEVCACDCKISCDLFVTDAGLTTQEGLGELKDCVSDVCDCDCVESGE